MEKVLPLVFCVLVAPITLISSASNETEILPEVPLKRCAQVNRRIRPRFHLVRRCSRSDMHVLASANLSSLWRCTDFAIYKRGLALNFGWQTGGIGRCEVLECPEFDMLSTLLRRENFDYYSLYAYPLPSNDWHCLPRVGIFRVGHGETRSTGQKKCREWAVTRSSVNETNKKEGTSRPRRGSLLQDFSGDADEPLTSASSASIVPQSLETSAPVPIPAFKSPPDGSLPSLLPFPPMTEDDFFLHPELIPEELFFTLWGPDHKETESLSANASSDSNHSVIAGQLADVLWPDRTTNLTTFLLSKEGKYFSPALVGLASVPGDHRVFATSSGEPLQCFRFRAWAPGHPLPLKRFKAALLANSDRPKSTTNTNATVHVTNVQAKENATNESTNSTQSAKTEAMQNGTVNGTLMEEARLLAEKKRDEMTLCVYLRRDGLWQTRLCSTKTHFLCEFLPSGGRCRDANTSDERVACEYEKVGTTEERCSAWKDEMITTTMTPIEPEPEPEPDKGEGGGSDEDNEEDDNDDDEEGGEADDDDDSESEYEENDDANDNNSNSDDEYEDDTG